MSNGAAEQPWGKQFINYLLIETLIACFISAIMMQSLAIHIFMYTYNITFCIKNILDFILENIIYIDLFNKKKYIYTTQKNNIYRYTTHFSEKLSYFQTVVTWRKIILDNKKAFWSLNFNAIYRQIFEIFLYFFILH